MRRGAQLLAMLMVIGGAAAAGAAPLEDPPRPLALYPERPGAKFEDIEAEPGHVVRRAGLGIASSSIRATYGLSLERWGRDAPGPLPAGWRRATAAELEPDDADGFVPHPASEGDRLHAVLRTTLPASGWGVSRPTATCTLTDPSDGAQLLPWLPAPPASSESTTASTTAKPGNSTLDAFIPVGSRRGPMYLRCRVGGVANLSDAHVVWKIDVA